MGFLERAIKNGIRKGVSDAIGNAVKQAVEPAATDLANRAANSINQATQQTEQNIRQTSGLDGALSNLQRSMEGYATEAAKNIKICPSCGEGSPASNKFCRRCGFKLPETTVAQGAVCSNCGKQNTVGTKFCVDCGTKLPAALEQEQATAARDAAVLAEWDELLPQFPKWNFGGCDFNIEQCDGYCMFAASFNGNNQAARMAVENYRQYAMQCGYIMAGQYPTKEHLYCRVNGVCCHIDLEHCFDGDGDCPTVYFMFDEPYGGFDYVKPEPKPNIGLKDLFKF